MRLLLLLIIGFFAVQLKAGALSKSEITQKFISITNTSEKVKTSQSPIPGMYQIITDSEVFYVTKDGKHILSGGLHNFNHTLDNISQATLYKATLQELDRSDNLITFKARNERHVIYVFTDPTCGYCTKLHNSLSEYNKRGITVKYIPWPRGGEYFNNGLPNPTFTALNAALCSYNVKEAVDELFYRKTQPTRNDCSTGKLRNYIQIGKNLGVQATPVMIDNNGTFIAGYKKPDRLLYILNRSNYQ